MNRERSERTREGARDTATAPSDSRRIRNRSVRRTSTNEFLGLPWVSVALGPDVERGELRGHARGVIAVGDIATGIVAFGGWARGVFAFGGVATGIVSFGGLSIGLVTAFGGVALSALLAIGGAAMGTVAVGGLAAGQYAIGGAPYGTHVIGPRHIDPEALALFEHWGFPVTPRRWSAGGASTSVF